MTGLRRRDLDPDPLRQFERWWSEAASVVEAVEAVALATVGPDSRPSVRMVLAKGFDELGIRFFTGHGSRKARELAANPSAALLFHWQPLGRQVRVEGAVSRLGDEESALYFGRRPRGAQIAAWASTQSEPIGSRDELEERFGRYEEEFEGRDVPLPPHWGGYLLEPGAWEFWQHHDNRLHDRLRYRRDGGAWLIERLGP